EASEIPTARGIAPGSWINANFDVWIGDKEDIAAWELLARAREFYGRQLARHERGEAGAPKAEQLSAAFEALLMAEGSDWCWWFGPEHSSANDAEFDAFFRQLLSEAYQSLGVDAPDELAEPIKHKAAPAHVVAPSALLNVREGKLHDQHIETKETCLWGPQDAVLAAFDRILELSVARELLKLGKRNSFALVVALWEGGLPVDVLPAEGAFEVALGEDHFG